MDWSSQFHFSFWVNLCTTNIYKTNKQDWIWRMLTRIMNTLVWHVIHSTSLKTKPNFFSQESVGRKIFTVKWLQIVTICSLGILIGRICRFEFFQCCRQFTQQSSGFSQCYFPVTSVGRISAEDIVDWLVNFTENKKTTQQKAHGLFCSNTDIRCYPALLWCLSSVFIGKQ